MFNKRLKSVKINHGLETVHYINYFKIIDFCKIEARFEIYDSQNAKKNEIIENVPNVFL